MLDGWSMEEIVLGHHMVWKIQKWAEGLASEMNSDIQNFQQGEDILEPLKNDVKTLLRAKKWNRAHFVTWSKQQQQ